MTLSRFGLSRLVEVRVARTPKLNIKRNYEHKNYDYIKEYMYKNYEYRTYLKQWNAHEAGEATARN